MVEIEIILAGLYLIVGVSLLVQRKLWLDFAERIIADPVNVIFFSFPLLLLGLSIVVFHNVWDDVASVLVSVLGWIVVLKYSLFCLAPKVLLSQVGSREKRSTLYALGGVLFLIFSLLIFYLRREYFLSV